MWSLVFGKDDGSLKNQKTGPWRYESSLLLEQGFFHAFGNHSVQAGEVRRAGGMAGDGGLDKEGRRGEGGEGDGLQGEGGAVATVAATEPEDDGGKEAEGDGHREIGGEERGGDFAGALAGEDPEKVSGHAEGEKPEDGGPRAGQEGVEGHGVS